MTKSQQEAKVVRKAEFTFTKQQLAEHTKALENYYDDPMNTKNYLGNSGDPAFMYRWVKTNDPSRKDRVERLMRLGWVPVIPDEISYSRRNMAPSRFGDSVVIEEHGNGDLMQLMKIPVELWKINQEFKSKRAAQQPLFDINGNPLLGDKSKKTQKYFTDPNTGHTVIHQTEVGSDISM